jgi:Ca-activated chloride channel homolog
MSPFAPQDRSFDQQPLTLSVAADRALVRAGAESTRYAHVRFTAPQAPRRAERIPVNLALVLDRSGSMSGEKFVLARRAVEQALAQLRPDDRFALVVYDSAVDVIQGSTAATASAKRDALDRLARVEPRGTTDLGAGWLTGCEQIAREMDGRAINRCLLLTDGLANQGITDREELVRHAAALRERGVQTSTFGVGADFDERLLSAMADAAGGHFYFIASAVQIPDLIASEVGEALEVVIRQAVLEVRLASGMTADPLARFHSARGRPDGDGRPGGGRTVRVDLGDLVSGQEVEMVVALRFPRGEAGTAIGAEFGLVDADGVPCAPSAALRWTYAPHADNDRQPRDRMVDRQVATLYAARARAEAVEHNRAGNYERARHVLTRTAERIRSYAGGDRELNRLADELLRSVEEFAEAPMSAMQMKARFFAADAEMRSRTPAGAARRQR